MSGDAFSRADLDAGTGDCPPRLADAIWGQIAPCCESTGQTVTLAARFAKHRS